MHKRTLLLSIVAFSSGALLALWISDSAPRAEPRPPTAAAPTTPTSASAPALPDVEASGGTALPNPQERLQTTIDRERRSVLVLAVEQVVPSVVAVEVEVDQTVNPFPFGTFWDPAQRDFFERMFPFRSYTRRQRRPAGTALVISDRGDIVTNYHVIVGADRVFVTLTDGRSAEASVAGSDPNRDLALLKVDLDGLRVPALGSSSDLYMGEWVVAVGFPVQTRQSGQHTVTVGVVSALSRTFQPRRSGRVDIYYADMIQTDAAINPGNSGGPLANAAGEVIGINTFILSEGGGSEGLGFAIPIERTLRIAQEITRYGRVRPIAVNFNGQPVTQQLAEALNLEATAGLLVSSVASGSAAANSGLVAGDVILDIEGLPVTSIDDALAALSPHFVGQTVNLGVMRASRLIELSLELEEFRGR